MKKTNNLIDRFLYRFPNFGIENLMKYIAIGTGVFWLIGMVNPVLLSYLMFSPYAILHGQVWRLFSLIFYPPSSGMLTFIAIYFYYYIGSTLEANWGKGRFTLYILISLVLTELYAFLIYFIFRINANVTATYIYLSMFFAFAAIYPDMQVLLFFIIPIKMKWLALVDAAVFIVGIFQTSFPVNLLPVVAIINFVIFCGDDLLKMLGRRPTKAAINFKREAAKIRREQSRNLYNHKCAVCGKTDTDYPDLQFRYCSRCAGYHCFCEEHINTHIHFTE